LTRNIKKKLDANDCRFGNHILILSLHYLVKCRSHAVIECAVGPGANVCRSCLCWRRAFWAYGV